MTLLKLLIRFAATVTAVALFAVAVIAPAANTSNQPGGGADAVSATTSGIDATEADVDASDRSIDLSDVEPIASIESCAGVLASIGGNAWGWVAAALSGPFCGSYLGQKNADFICWQSRQWWGAPARARVWVMTFGRYTRC